MEKKSTKKIQKNILCQLRNWMSVFLSTCLWLEENRIHISMKYKTLTWLLASIIQLVAVAAGELSLFYFISR